MDIRFSLIVFFLQCSPVFGTSETKQPLQIDQQKARIEHLQKKSECMSLKIFHGAKKTCHPPGLDESPLNDCCKNKEGKIEQQGQGSLTGLAASGMALSHVGSAISACYQAYTTTKSIALAAESMSSNLLSLSIGSTGVGIAVAGAMHLLTKGCSQEDMETALLSDNGFCVYVGDYCEHDELGVCLQEAKSYCCFNSKLARLMHVQGRPQLRRYQSNVWGSAASPDCSGFYPEDFETLDFSKIDLSEFLNELMVRAESKNKNLRNIIDKSVRDKL